MAKVLISIPDPMLKAVDQAAKRGHLSRSEATRLAYQQWLRSEQRDAPKDRPGFSVLDQAVRKSRRLPDGRSAEAFLRDARGGR